MAVRNYRLVFPTLDALQPEDLILSTPRKWDLGTPFIKLGQRIRYSWDDARWNHASLYAGPGYRIIHTNPDHGVAESDLESMVRSQISLIEIIGPHSSRKG